MYKNISLEEMLKTEVDSILTNYENGSTDYYYKNGEGEFHEITELDLLRGRFYTEDGDFSEFEWELEESHIYIRQWKIGFICCIKYKIGGSEWN